MEKTSYTFRRIGMGEFSHIKELFTGVFTREPWNDDWSDEAQLDLYLSDLVDQSNSLTFGLYEGQALIGLSMGRIKHWYTGTEYCIDELCIRTDRQRQGLGSYFLEELQRQLQSMGIEQIFLQTDRDVPAYRFYLKNGFLELSDLVSFAKTM